MNTDKRHIVLCLILVLLLAATGYVLAQGTGEETKTPLPVPESPVVTLESNIVGGVETGEFIITSPNVTQFENAEFVEWIAANESTRDDVEGTLDPSYAGTIRVSATDLGYQDGDIISFSLTSLAALDDATYTDTSHVAIPEP